MAGFFDQPRRLICVDPGEDTGVALLEISSSEEPVMLVDYCTLPYDNLRIYSRLGALFHYETMHVPAGFNTIIFERFVHRPGRPFDATAYEVTGTVKTWHAIYQNLHDPMFRYIERVPVQGKKEADNDVLRKLGVHLKGHHNRHINDATRHGVSWLLEQGHRGTALVGKPKDADD